MRFFEMEVLKDGQQLYEVIVNDSEEENKVLRSAAFQRVVPEVYTYRCAITGMQVSNDRHVRLIDACHIVPWVDTFDDSISNGIALSPTLHRAFDRGMIGIAEDYSVIVAKDLREAESAHALLPFRGQRLNLPYSREHWPGLKNLAEHRERWGL